MCWAFEPSLESRDFHSCVHVCDRPKVLAIVVPPPDPVTVGVVFPVSVFVGLADSVPLANIRVVMKIAPASQGDLEESTDSFIGRLSGQPPTPKSSWTAPSFAVDTDVATTNKDGIATFLPLLSGAVNGRFTFSFSVSTTLSVRVRARVVVSSLASLASGSMVRD